MLCGNLEQKYFNLLFTLHVFLFSVHLVKNSSLFLCKYSTHTVINACMKIYLIFCISNLCSLEYIFLIIITVSKVGVNKRSLLELVEVVVYIIYVVNEFYQNFQCVDLFHRGIYIINYVLEKFYFGTNGSKPIIPNTLLFV